jgi:uncharacterized damage-inducible protein DinB
MKEITQLLSENNALTNIDMIKILDVLPTEKLIENNGSYYDSILGILNHILVTDIAWYKFFIENFEEAFSLKTSIPGINPGKWKEIIWSDLKTYKTLRFDFDNLIKDVYRLIPEDKYNDILIRKNFRGVEEKIIAWHGFIHVFNHETHHRGQISLILDQFKIENDYSNLIWRFRN